MDPGVAAYAPKMEQTTGNWTKDIAYYIGVLVAWVALSRIEISRVRGLVGFPVLSLGECRD